MEITWLGHACFKIRGREATVITDPYDNSVGYNMGKQAADVITVSHSHSDHNAVANVGGTPKVVDRPGEYEVSNILIRGISTFHDSERGAKRGKNTVFLIEMEDLTICHLGDIGHVPTAEQAEELSNVDVLMIPVGGSFTLDASAAVETISLIQPKIAVPMHYKTPMLKFNLDPVDKFLKEVGLPDTVPQARLNVTKSNVPESTQVVVLEYKGG